MELNLANKTALITGASKGIGEGIAMTMAKEGCNISNAYNVNVRVLPRT